MSWGGSGIGQAIQELGRCNRPPCLRNHFFPKSVHPAIGVPGMTDPVAVYLEEFDARDGCILEIRIYQQGGTEVSPLMINPLLSRILGSACFHGFLRSVKIMQEISSGRGG